MTEQSTPTGTDAPPPPPSGEQSGWAPGSPPQMPPGPPSVPPPAPAKQPGKWRAIVPIVVIVGFLAVVLWAVRDNQSADDLTAGICFDIPTATSVSTVTRHACTEPHDAEVFHNVEYTGGSAYPISLTLDRFINDTCGPVYATYVGEARADLTVGYFYPSRDSWSSGDRTITCYASRVDEAKLTESIKGSAGS